MMFEQFQEESQHVYSKITPKDSQGKSTEIEIRKFPDETYFVLVDFKNATSSYKVYSFTQAFQIAEKIERLLLEDIILVSFTEDGREFLEKVRGVTVHFGNVVAAEVIESDGSFITLKIAGGINKHPIHTLRGITTPNPTKDWKYLV